MIPGEFEVCTVMKGGGLVKVGTADTRREALALRRKALILTVAGDNRNGVPSSVLTYRHGKLWRQGVSIR
jgi:hypothetical protein